MRGEKKAISQSKAIPSDRRISVFTEIQKYDFTELRFYDLIKEATNKPSDGGVLVSAVGFKFGV